MVNIGGVVVVDAVVEGVVDDPLCLFRIDRTVGIDRKAHVAHTEL